MSRRYWDAELESRPWAEVQAWQAEQLGPWVQGLIDRSEFHREALADHALPERFDSLAALAELPTTRKDDVRESQSSGVAGQPFGRHQAVPLGDVVQALSSSGTTGDPVYFALTRNDLESWNQTIATALWTAGVRPDDVAAHLVGLPGVAGGLPYADGFRTIGATLVWLGGLSTEKIVRALPKVQASVVLATSSFGTYLADQCRELADRDADKLGVRNLLGGGEPGLGQPEIREKIVSGWGLEAVHETMGLGDVLSMLWAECDEGVPEALHAADRLQAAALDAARAVQWPVVADVDALRRAGASDAAAGMASILDGYVKTLPRVLVLAASSAE